jgi:hypothetical protein
MFINCPYCRALVATDPVTDLPPTHCPQCASLLRRDDSAPAHEEQAAEPVPLDLGDLLAVPITDTLQDRGDPTPSIAIVDSTENASASENTHAAIDIDRDIDNAEATAHGVDDAASSAVPDDGAAAPAIATIKRSARGTPSFAQRPERTTAPSRERWLPGVAAALAVVLVLQLLLADRARLASDARWRPLLSTLCRISACDLPPWREPAAFTLLQRDVRQHPSVPGALRVSATFRNDARWSQPWPELQLRLSDMNGQVAGERSFAADDYLGGTPGQPELASGETATVAMDVLEPAARIVAYDFSFR